MFKKLNGIKLEKNSIEWINSPKELKIELLKKIHSAKDRIYISALYIEGDAAGVEILKALLLAKENNPSLTIKIFVDYHRARRGLIGQVVSITNQKVYQELLSNSSLEIIGVPVKLKEVLGVLHLKGFIFDEQIIFSGASLNNIYLYEEDRYRIDRYYLISNLNLANSMSSVLDQIASDPATVDLITDEPINKNMIKSFKSRLNKIKYKFDSKISSGNRIIPYIGLGARKNDLNKLVINLVRSAEKEIFICTPYFNPTYSLSRSIIAMLKKGVKVNLVVGDKTANDFFIPEDKPFSTIGLIPYIYELSLRKFSKKQQWAIDDGLLNIYIWKHDTNSFHLKGISVDNKNHLITGSNLNPRAFNLDLENGLLLLDEDGEYANNFIKEQSKIIKHANKLLKYKELESFKDYPIRVKKKIRGIRSFRIDLIIKRIL